MIEKYNTGGRLMKRFDKVKFMCPVDSSMVDGYVSVSNISDLDLSRDVVVLPGFCDVHVHFREPGFSYK